MSNIPTAEGFLDFDPRISTQWSDEIKDNVICRDDVELAMIEFAKLHVEAALKAAADSASFSYNASRGKVNYHVYPLENIK